MKKYRWKTYLSKGIKILSETADVAVHLKGNSGPVGLLAVGSRFANSLSEISSRENVNFFKKWFLVRDVSPLESFLFSLCKDANLFVEEASFTKLEQKRILTANLGGYTLGWEEYKDWTHGPFCPPGQNIEKTVEQARELIWQMMGNAVKYHAPMLGSPVLLNDDLQNTLASSTADRIWNKQRRFLAKGYKRAVLLYGEPGTGKSHIARHITNKAGGRRLRLKARDLESLRNLAQLIGFLKPNGVMVDDLDRAREPEGFIEEFDEIKSRADLFLVTVNVVSKLDPAIVRRFDDNFCVKELDKEVLDNLLKGIPKSVAHKLEGLPVVYIDRYREAVDALGEEEAETELDRLISQRTFVLKMMEEDVSLQGSNVEPEKAKAEPKALH